MQFAAIPGRRLRRHKIGSVNCNMRYNSLRYALEYARVEVEVTDVASPSDLNDARIYDTDSSLRVKPAKEISLLICITAAFWTSTWAVLPRLKATIKCE
jgi:hypothetical protein